ncbi:uncharacterized protein LOC110451997 [Mizuhopecten yessoensis]|uniref:Uncharacterized protein n=1 Tax=Mizuhopecten yessoensis TaxID=6573 RepID=A0A210QKN5_MIZYE|nr:uncharacterized protein LOC110451997 [Mizuhopecten yessoensis]OWF49307.1 hypothetical protein KP79_PYT23369 [Mizuhopecten yessoensis]
MIVMASSLNLGLFLFMVLMVSISAESFERKQEKAEMSRLIKRLLVHLQDPTGSEEEMNHYVRKIQNRKSRIDKKQVFSPSTVPTSTDQTAIFRKLHNKKRNNHRPIVF